MFPRIATEEIDDAESCRRTGYFIEAKLAEFLAPGKSRASLHQHRLILLKSAFEVRDLMISLKVPNPRSHFVD